MDHSPLRVLLLDPNFVTRIALTSRLEASGYMVRAEKSVGTAARAATASNWDLVLASASLSAPDLEAFLETLSLTECKSSICVVTESEDSERKDLAARYKARLLRHPVRPQSLTEFLTPKAAEPESHPAQFFRTA